MRLLTMKLRLPFTNYNENYETQFKTFKNNKKGNYLSDIYCFFGFN